MSDTFKCLLTTVDKVEKIEDTERLFRVWIRGWVFVASGIPIPVGDDHEGDHMVVFPPYEEGQSVVYIQPDSVLDAELIKFAFPEGMEGKIKPDSLEKHRIKIIKIRKNISEGLLLNPDKLKEVYPKLSDAKVGDDVKDILNIKKYEPSAAAMPRHMQVEGKVKHPMFKEYIDINNFKYYPDLFERQKSYITEKIHGTSARYSILPAFPGPVFKVTKSKPVFLFQWKYKPRVKLFDMPTKVDFFRKNLFLQIKKLLRLPLGYEFLVGSRRTEITLRGYKNGYYETDVYTKIANQENIKDKLKPNEELFGEIVGDNIQSSYTYGCKKGEHKFFAYDVYDHNQNRWLTPIEFLEFCRERGFNHVPVLNKDGNAFSNEDIACFIEVAKASGGSDLGPFHDFDAELIEKLKKGNSTIGNQKIREGVVVKSIDEVKDPRIGRKVLKVISEDYLTQKNLQEWH